MRDKDGNSAYASYSSFYIDGSTADYTLHVSGYSGTAGDALTQHDCMTMIMIKEPMIIVPFCIQVDGGIRIVITPV